MALRYELTMLKDIVEKKIDPKTILGIDIMEEFFAEMKNVVIHETERVENELRESMMNIKKEHQKKEYILQHQVNIVRLADRIYEYLMPKDRDSLYRSGNVYTADSMYREVFKSLEKLLQFIEKDFPDFFDKRAKAPDAWRWLLEMEVRGKLSIIKKDLQVSGVEEGLIEVACMPLAGLLVNESELSYYLYEFLQTLFKKLSSFPHLSNCNNSTERLLKVLWRINYNSMWLYNYSVIEYDKTVKSATNISVAIHYLQAQEKILRQTTVRIDVSFRKEQPMITALLTGWINEELKLLKEEQAQSKLLKQMGKIVTILSVEELGYGCRLLHGQGMFPDIEEGELLDIVAASFITPKSKDISADSIKNKSGKPGPNAKQKVKGHLYEMARMVR